MTTPPSSKKSRSNAYRGLFVVCLLCIALLSVMPEDVERGFEMPHLTESGFFMHVLAYFVATLLGVIAWAMRASLLFFIMIYSSGLEFLQRAIPWRNFNVWDLVANFVGIALALSIVFLLNATGLSTLQKE